MYETKTTQELQEWEEYENKSHEKVDLQMEKQWMENVK